MNHNDFDILTEKRFKECWKTLTKKRKDYSSEGDRLHNFYAGAEILDCTPERYLMALVTKHWVSLNDMVKDPNNISWERFFEVQGDIINYMVLLEGLLTVRLDD